VSQCTETLVGLTVAEAVEYRSEIENAPAEQGFYRLRQARVAVVGEGPALGAVLRAGLGTGWRQTRVFTTGSVPEYAVRDEFQHVLTDQVDRFGAYLAETDLVVHVSSDLADLIEMGRRCRAANVSLTQVFMRGRDAWITPVHTAGGRPTEAAWRRLAPEDEPAVLPKRVPGALMAAAYEGRLDEPGAVLLKARPKAEVEAVTAALIGAQTALTCFRHLTGATSAAEPTLLRLDRDTLEITEMIFDWLCTVVLLS
jgi:hypothetical protein